MAGIFLTLFRPYEELFYYQRDGAIDEWAWESATAPIRQVMSTPGFRDWWQIRGEWFSPDFQAYINRLVAMSLPDRPNLLDDYKTLSAPGPTQSDIL